MEGKEIQGYTREMLTGDAREVAEELRGNIAGFFQERGVGNLSGLDQSLRQGSLSVSDIAPVKRDIKLLQQILHTGEVPEQLLEKRRMKDAERIFGPDFLGPEAVKNTFGTELSPEEVPEVPFTREEMEHARELDQMLVLRVDKTGDGQPLTLRSMKEIMQPRFEQEGRGNAFYDQDWYDGEDFFENDKPQTRWALVSKNVLPNSTGKNYLQQTEQIADHVRGEVFQGGSVPPEYQEALDEFEQEKADIAKIILPTLPNGDPNPNYDWQTAADKLSELKLNQLTRRKPVEAMYDILMRIENNEERLLEDKYDWTISRSSNGGLVGVGHFGADGASVSDWYPDDSDPDIGVVLSRK